MPYFKKFLLLSVLVFFAIASGRSFININGSQDLQQPQETKTPVASSNDTTAHFPIKKYEQKNYDELEKKYPMDMKQPDNVKTVVDYDIRSGNYIIRTMVGNMEVATPYMMTPQEYMNYSSRQEMQDYWKLKNNTVALNNEDKFSLSDMKFDIGPADKIFGPGGVQVKTQGSAELLFGVKHNRVENPALTERNRSTTTPDFDMKIQLNVNGSVGDKVNFGLNYNTESTFDFDQKAVKLAYKGKEDDIIQSIQAGNVSMPLNSSLITGSTALFGIKTDLKFGKLSVSAIATQQESETKTVSSKGGVQTTKFEISADEYDANRHFFIGQYFRDHFESSMSKLPYVSSGVTINRIEVWVTNKKGDYDEARNIMAFMDLAEPDKIDKTSYWSKISNLDVPQNNANNLYKSVKDIDGIRDVQQSNSVLSAAYPDLVGGEDFEKVESARKLDASEYTLNTSLGILSLKSALNSDEVLAIAYEYSYGGNVYQVGEFSTDNIEAPNSLMVKLLRGTTQSPSLPTWNLMMKNVYNLGGTQMQKDNFELNIVYTNDSAGTEVQYLSEGNIKDKLLLRVMNLDKLDSRNNANPDGKFDYVEGLTAVSSSGRVIFPVLEPFGSHLAKQIDPNYNPANPSALVQKYIFQELYDSTLVVAQEYTDKNKFKLVGKYKASSSSQINLNATNIPSGSVTVTAGGVTLTENVDYTVDYLMGTLTILNQSILDAGTEVSVKLENQSTYSMERKSLFGTHLEYQFNKDFSVGGTIMHLSETPLTTKVNTGSEPISNTIWGMNMAWRGESQWLTNAIDKLPFVNATKPSTIAVNAEFAQLIPGHSSVVGSAGLAYIDDFESTQTSIDIHYPSYWFLASTPYDPSSDALFPEAASATIDYGKNRALLAWYKVDQVLNSKTPGSSTPVNLRNNTESQSNHYTRDVKITEVFPNKSYSYTDASLLSVMNLSFYPTERGPYNLDVDGMDTDGNLTNPQKRWGGIMRKLDNTDFESSNIEYIEFWMMDPFIYDENGTDNGGELYFNLGDVSEDILKDGKKFFEHGLPVDGDETKTETTIWGKVPKTQSTVVAFDNTDGAREKQDVGLNGLSTAEEFLFPTYSDYVAGVKSKVNAATLAKMESDKFSPLNDPAGDNYSFYKSTDYDKESADILTRYKHYNGTEGNSPDANNSTEDYSTSATTIPDVEDINGDNTLNEYEKYYQYHVAIKKDSMQVGMNYITDSYTASVDLADGKTDKVTWYQFKIPIRDYEKRVGSIRNFKSIRFIRMFMTGFSTEKHLRLATLDLVRGEWRNYTKDLYSIGAHIISDGTLDVQAVNIEENSDKTPVNYVLPPGVTRQTDPSQSQLLMLNEQSQVLKVTNLSPNDARAVYKNTSYDFRQYKKLQMFVHAEKLSDDAGTLSDGELTCFIRLGSDLVNNYYEYEIPLKVTPAGVYSNNSTSDREIVWPESNMFNFNFSALTKAKLARNKSKEDGSYVSDTIPFFDQDNNKIRVIGNPSLDDVENIMIGVRNASKSIKSGEIWVNELRLAGYDESGGWAAMGNVAVGLSDIGTINFSGQMQTAGYGSIESSVLDRSTEDQYLMNFSTNMELGRFFPEKAKLQIPMYFSYSNETIKPKYDPTDADILLEDAVSILQTKQEKDSLLNLAQTVNLTKSFNITSAKVNIKSKKPQFYDPANVTFGYSSTENTNTSPEIEKDYEKVQKVSVSYSYSFNPQPVEPFKNVKFLNKPIFKIIKDINFYYLPSYLSYTSDMNRAFTMSQLRNLTGGSTSDLDLSYSKDFMWNRNLDIKYDLTRNLKLAFQTATNANITETEFTPEIGKEYYESWRDTVWSSIKKLGTPYTYQQVFSASWTLPINKIPFFDWITSNVSYNSNYTWNRLASSDLGNVASTTGAWSGDAQLNFESLYNKSKYLKDVNRRLSMQVANKGKYQQREFKKVYSLEKGKKIMITHRLGTNQFVLDAKDKYGKPLKLNYRSVNAAALEVQPAFDADSVTISIATVNPDNRTTAQQVVDYAARFLMMARRLSVTYRQSQSMTLAGFNYEPGTLGQQKDLNNVNAPGYGFTFGLFDNNTIKTAVKNGWLVINDSIINPATTAYTSDLDIKATLEPIPGFKIDLNAKRYTANNTSVQYMYDGMPTTYNGSYNTTLVAISTAFKKVGNGDNNYASEVFDKFLANRDVIAGRLNAKLVGTKYPTTGFFQSQTYKGADYNSTYGKYELNSADVLIPAFIAAYTGKDAKTMDTNPFLSLLNLFPNWRVSYDGLSKIDWIKDHFKSVSLTHAYTCRYSVGSYSSYSTWVAMDDGSSLGYINQSDFPVPSSKYDISTVSLNEQFSPLIGINAALKNSLTTKFEYRKQRNYALNLSSTQLIEATSDEYVVGLGYLVKDFDVILRLKNNQQSKIKNDLKINADVSYKDVKSLLRKVTEDLTQASSGSKLFTLKVTADYVFSSKLNIQMYYDTQSTTPLISSTYPVSATNFGVSFKFMLTR